MTYWAEELRFVKVTAQAMILRELDGRVVTLELDLVLLRRAVMAVRRVGLAALVSGVQANALSLPLRGDSVDRALLITVLGEIPEPVMLLGELYRVLRPGGTVLIVEEWVDPGFWPARRVQTWAAAVGFALQRQDGRPWRYALLLRKTEN